jgi:glucose-1-phosphate thymidylyltransferase
VKAIIPAAGIGTRLRPLTLNAPKALLPVAGNTILGFILDDLSKLKVDEVVIVVGFMGEKIEEWVRSRYDLRVQFVRQEKQLGLGHAVHVTREAGLEGPVLMILGDTIIRARLEGAFEENVSFLGVKEVEDPRRFGVVEVEEGKVSRLVEKPSQPASNLALAGLYFFRRIESLYEAQEECIREDRTTRGEYQVTDAIQLLVERGEIFRPFFIEDWLDCGNPETLLDANRALLEGTSPPSPPQGVTIRPPVHLAPGSRVEDSTIGPYVSIGKRAVVAGSVVENSIVDEEARVEGSRLRDSLIGKHAEVSGSGGRLVLADYCRVVRDGTAGPPRTSG